MTPIPVLQRVAEIQTVASTPWIDETAKANLGDLQDLKESMETA